MTSKFLIAFLWACSFTTFAQTKSEINDSTELIYFYVGDGCPSCIDQHPEKIYGFTIKCTGCLMTNEIEKSNQDVIQKIDKKRGLGWTEKFIDTYCDDIKRKSKTKKLNQE